MAQPRIPIEIRFWKYVNKTDTCWLWTGNTAENGYGRIRLDGVRKTAPAHRVSYEMVHGPVQEGLFVCHCCDVKNCVRPDHLFLGTMKDNMVDAAEKMRMTHGVEHANAVLTPELVREIRLMAGTVGTRVIAKRFGIGRNTVTRVLKGITWKHVDGELPENINARMGHPIKLTEADVLTIRELATQGMSNAEVARRYNVSAPTISGIVRGLYWKHVKTP